MKILMYKSKNTNWRLLTFIASIFIGFFVQSQAQTVKISGNVTDGKEAIIGATVTVKELKKCGNCYQY